MLKKKEAEINSNFFENIRVIFVTDDKKRRHGNFFEEFFAKEEVLNHLSVFRATLKLLLNYENKEKFDFSFLEINIFFYIKFFVKIRN